MSNNGQVSVEFKKFGVGLAFTPTVLSNGQINLKIDPEVSELDTANSVTMYGTTIPGLNVRRATTTVELRDGQTFMIAGFSKGKYLSDTQGLPWVANVPVLGTLFRSEAYQKTRDGPRHPRNTAAGPARWCRATRSRRRSTTEGLRATRNSSSAVSRKFR